MEIHPKWLPQCQVANHPPSHPCPQGPDVTTTKAKGIGEKRKPAHGQTPRASLSLVDMDWTSDHPPDNLSN